MITASHTVWMKWFGWWYVPWLLHRHFEAVHFLDVPNIANRAVLLLSNHQSWWDPFLVIRANQRYFHKKYFVMMLEHELRRRPGVRQAGAFSIKPGSRSILNSLEYATTVLQNPQHLLHIFPQGRISSPCSAAITFRRGIRYILEHAEPQYQICFTALFLHYFNKPRPEAFAFFRLVNEQSPSFASLNKSYQDFYDQCRQQVELEYQKRF
ncbi:MAG: lysophospholipid acyltransferase family protein [Chitinophagales bacterium]|nr:lysophospholipid acyltransferase family protein [Chitinophagales bacterium]MDW8427657.1 lysophospholipid acyltransferase family protein [Chitinophagales bacterium]